MNTLDDNTAALRAANRALARRRAIRAYGESGCEPIMFCPISHDDLPTKPSEKIARLLVRRAIQERMEKAMCYGMMLGGGIAMSVLTVTLWALGIL